MGAVGGLGPQVQLEGLMALRPIDVYLKNCKKQAKSAQNNTFRALGLPKFTLAMLSGHLQRLFTEILGSNTHIHI